MVPPPHDDEVVTLRPVGSDDWREVAGLTVTEAQRAFVAEPTYYLSLCAYGGGWHPLSVRLGGRVIGFLMWAVEATDGSCWIGGFFIDARFQRQGHGRRALATALRMLADARGHRRFALSYRPDNPAKPLYAALGFEETGEAEDGEVVARLSLPVDDASVSRGASWRPDTGSAGLRIREGTRADLPEVVALLADDPLGATRERPGEPLDPAYAVGWAAMRAQAGNVLLVAEAAGGVVGCLQFVVIPGLARTGMQRAQIEGVRVARAHRGQGIGERLVEAAVERAVAEGCGLMQLATDVTRPDARRFYERLGFVASHHGMKRALP
jgi:ribosomal protein S18 acetylase RimI-like enzyme